MNDLIAKQWQRFGHNVKLWHGYWSRWDPRTHETKIAFRSMRHFKFFDESKTKVWHQNTWTYEDGKVDCRGPWELTMEGNIDANRGFFHTVTAAVASAFFNENGSFVNTSPELISGKAFGVEFGLIRSPLRCSVICLYNEKGELSLSGVREDERGLEPSAYWTADNQLKETAGCVPNTRRFVGEEQTVTAAMEDKAVVSERPWNGKAWEKPGTNELLLCLPDGISVKCQEDVSRLSRGATFTVAVCWVYGEGGDMEVREHTAYFVEGKYSHMKLGIYHSVKE